MADFSCMQVHFNKKVFTRGYNRDDVGRFPAVCPVRDPQTEHSSRDLFR
jgi:hypothetical protein